LVNWAQCTQGITLPDLRYHVRLLMRGNPIEELETNQKELRIVDLNEETEYQVQVCAARRDVETGHVKKADYSPLTSFFIKREISAQPLPEQPKLAFPSSPFQFNWHDDSVTALLLFLFAILAVLIALCGHHMH